MSNLMFFVRCLFITAVFIILMQVRVGEITLEEKAMSWMSSSLVIEPIQQVADGAVKIIRDSIRKVSSGFKTNFWQSISSEKSPGTRQMEFDLNRSKAYLEEKTRKATNSIRNEFEKENTSSTGDREN